MCSHNGPIGRRKCGYILTADQSSMITWFHAVLRTQLKRQVHDPPVSRLKKSPKVNGSLTVPAARHSSVSHAAVLMRNRGRSIVCGPTRRSKRGYILITDQSDAVSVGIFS
eukprot:404260-Pyramimonas_sp.AAC.1